jgi:uncharacterized membrane protein (UPF0136 family)
MKQQSAVVRIASAATVLCALYVLYLTFFLKFNPFVSDVQVYWKESLQWRQPFSTWFVPGYPLAIALTRALTLNLLPPVYLMIFLCSLFYVTGVIAVFEMAADLRTQHPVWLSLLFAVFPFVGLTYVGYPIADNMAVATLLLSYLFFIRRKWGYLAICAGIGLITHKATWYFIPLLLILAYMSEKKARKTLPLALLPLLVLVIGGAIYYNDLFWMFRWSVEHLIVSKSTFPVFDGIIGSFMSTSKSRLIRGVVVLSFFIVAIALSYWSWRNRSGLALATSLPIVLMGITVNQYEIWALARFSRVLIVPLLYYLSQNPAASSFFGRIRIVLFVGSLITNLVFGYYLAQIFFQ